MLRLIFAALALFSAAQAQSGPVVETGHARSRLIAEKTAAVPGETLWVALAQELDEGWHVYWKNPGDSGLPLVLDWDLPEGFEAGEIGYPLPHRLPLGPLTNFGHEGEPVFIVPIEVPEDAEIGSAARLTVKADWLICLDVCIPESARLSLDIPIAAAAQDAAGQATLIKAARSAQPVELGLEAAFADQDGEVILKVQGVPGGQVYVFPEEGGMIEPSAPQPQTREGEALYIALTPGLDYQVESPDTLSAVLVIENGSDDIGVAITARRSAEVLAEPAVLERMSADVSEGGAAGGSRSDGGNVPLVLAFAFLGGLILNAMPCVFPIVFLKAAGIAKLAGAASREVRRDAFAYTAGVLVTFAAMAVLLLGLRAAGAQLGWGFHLQSPIAVGLFAVIVFLIGLNLAGLFELGTSVQGAGQGLTQKAGAAGSFFTGLLAVLVAAPCIGPFLGVPVGYALTAPPVLAVLVFLVLGLGLAAPYLALAAAPGLARRLPRPGPWMVRLKQLFAFAMFGTAVWLTWVVSLQAGPNGVLLLGIAFVLSGLAAWLFGIAQETGGGLWRAGAVAVLALALAPLFAMPAQPAASTEANVETVAYDEAVLANLQAEGTPVFIDFTAAWCVTCQYNKRVVLKTKEAQELFARTGTVFMVADLTNPDPVITAAIERQGRSGVPLYLYYRGLGDPEILPQILTVERLKETLETRG
ncbi:MAG: protein-disulfide reductase DsbD domain-containing protein [Parvularcula sp.]|jgi:thiol:disulfide interchange protein DsbD|nr:protein-disulfide reductase DsbD domain-containing protein [Parvularcula sp.]